MFQNIWAVWNENVIRWFDDVIDDSRGEIGGSKLGE